MNLHRLVLLVSSWYRLLLKLINRKWLKWVINNELLQNDLPMISSSCGYGKVKIVGRDISSLKGNGLHLFKNGRSRKSDFIEIVMIIYKENFTLCKSTWHWLQNNNEHTSLTYCLPLWLLKHWQRTSMVINYTQKDKKLFTLSIKSF